MSSLATIRLAPEIVNAWRQALLRSARLPRGVNPKTHTPAAMLQTIVKSEADEVARLWNIFTQDREDLSRHLLSEKRSAVAYLLGFHLANAARAQMVLTRAHVRQPLAKALRNVAGPILWHDLGCGTGALAQVVMHDLVKSKVPLSQVEMHLSDLSGTLLDTAKEVFQAAGWGENVSTHKYLLEKLSPARLAPTPETGLTGYSLGYVWNELARNKAAREALLRVFEERVAKNQDALVLVLEPAMQELAREAMSFRDTMVELGYGVIYPCPHTSSCPLLERSRDWCYSEALWEVPKEIQRLDEMLDMDRSRLSGAGYLLASPSFMKRINPPSTTATQNKKQDEWGVVVGRPARTTGRGFDYLICSPDGMKKSPQGEGDSITPRGVPMRIKEHTREEPRKTTRNANAPGKPRRRG